MDNDRSLVMTYEIKPNVHRVITKIDRKTQAVTASVDFEDIDLQVDGKGSEYWDYEYLFVLHSQSDSTATINCTLENFSGYSYDRMQGAGSTANATSTTRTSIEHCATGSSTYPSFLQGKITGYVGNKRHHDSLHSQSTSTPLTIVRKMSFYTDDTATEIDSIQFACTKTNTITYSLVIVAVPKIQYNPNAVLIKHLPLSSQTADIIFGGVNDTEGVDDLDGDLYDYVVVSSIETDATLRFLEVYVNEVTTGNKTRQWLRNANGTIGSLNSTTTTYDSIVHTGSTLMSADTGRKKIATTTLSSIASNQQQESASWNPDTATKMTSLMFRPNVSLNGDIWLYAVPKGYNADLIPWDFRQEIDINGDFSAGHSFEIPDWAMFMKVDFVGENLSTGTNSFQLDFNSLGISTDRQDLYSNSSSTTAAFVSTNNIGSTNKVCNISGIVALKSGANRPALFQNSFAENKILIMGHWFKDSSSVFASAQIKANDTDSITGKLVVSFY